MKGSRQKSFEREVSMTKKFYAHSLSGRPREEWQLLEDHLKNVAEMARGFADAFGVGGGTVFYVNKKEVIWCYE